MFKQLCNNNDESFESLLHRTEVQWLSKGTSLARFYSLFDTVLEFLQSCDPDFTQEVMLARNDTACLSDIFAKLNALNLALQGNEVNLIKVKSAMSGFKNKLVVCQRNLARRDFLQFSSLQYLIITVTVL